MGVAKYFQVKAGAGWASLKILSGLKIFRRRDWAGSSSIIIGTMPICFAVSHFSSFTLSLFSQLP
jgi:hypothetical protein